jgi:hypothetical protein
MTKFPKLTAVATAAFAAATLVAAAAPARAAVIDVMALTKDKWKWSVSSAPVGTFSAQPSAIKAGTAPVPTANVDFGFQIGGDQGVYPGLLVLTLSETGVAAPPITMGPDGTGGTYTYYSQPGLTGSFKLEWEGGNGLTDNAAHPNAYVPNGTYDFNGVILHNGDTVLTGTLTDGIILVTNDTHVVLGHPKTVADTGVLDATFTDLSSPVNLIQLPATTDLQLNVAPTGLWKYVVVHGVNQLAGFADEGNGDVMASVPEPAAWSMMIVGAAMIGGVARRRRLVAVA